MNFAVQILSKILHHVVVLPSGLCSWALRIEKILLQICRCIVQPNLFLVFLFSLPTGDIKQYCNPFVHPYVCLFHAPS